MAPPRRSAGSAPGRRRALGSEFESHPVGPLGLGLGDLRRSTGTVVSSDLLRLDPGTVELPARCARAVAVTLSVGDPLDPGVYRGMLQADGAPEFGVIVELTVENPGP